MVTPSGVGSVAAISLPEDSFLFAVLLLFTFAGGAIGGSGGGLVGSNGGTQTSFV